MSLVGTRPILQDELRQYELHHRARIAIKPGITGMWQVSGRSDITDFEEVVRLDTEYISREDRRDSVSNRFCEKSRFCTKERRQDSCTDHKKRFSGNGERKSCLWTFQGSQPVYKDILEA